MYHISSFSFLHPAKSVLCVCLLMLTISMFSLSALAQEVTPESIVRSQGQQIAPEKANDPGEIVEQQEELSPSTDSSDDEQSGYNAYSDDGVLQPTERKNTDFPARKELYAGLDPGVILQESGGDKPSILFRANFRIGWCIRPWALLGVDYSLDVLIDSLEQGNAGGSQILHLMSTFFPVKGLYLRAGAGWDSSYVNRWSLDGGIGYEFGLNKRGGLAIGLTFSQIWHTTDRDNWRLYGLTIAFTGYHVNSAPSSFD